MKNKQNSTKLILSLVIIILIILVTWLWVLPTYNEVSNSKHRKDSYDRYIANSLTESKCGFSVKTPLKNTLVNFPLSVEGVVDNSKRQEIGCSWQMFEGQAGTAQLYYQIANEWKPLGIVTPITVTDSYATTTTFAFALNFNNGGIGLPSGTALKIIFTEENAAAINPSKTFELPLKLK